MSIFARHIKPSIAITVYYLCISLLVYHFYLTPPPPEPVCDFTSMLVFPTVAIGMIMSVAFSIKSFYSPVAVKNDYLWFTGIAAFPLVAFVGVLTLQLLL